MEAMVLNQLCDLKKERQPLALQDMPEPRPADNEILIKVSACGVCHTELDEIEGRTPPQLLPVILGHQAVGRVVDNGKQAKRYRVGDRVGVAWIHSACGQCDFCRTGLENLCGEFRATGRDADGGYAQYMTVSEGFAYKIPPVFSDAQAAPLLCAGAIGYRSLRLTGLKNGQKLGLLHCIIDTTPAWKPVVAGLKMLTPGGRLVINAIRKEEFDKDDLLKLNYPQHLWMEKEIKSVANVARRDVAEFLELAARIPFIPEVQEFALEDANMALMELKEQKIRGAKVLMIQ
jgi:propanol-preferring alcohol dehydrogenase